jgi:metal-dependent amidase/aminoacylase/carboxypeptidase family protein
MLILGETLIEMKDQFKGKVIIIHQPAEEKARPVCTKPSL